LNKGSETPGRGEEGYNRDCSETRIEYKGKVKVFIGTKGIQDIERLKYPEKGTLTWGGKKREKCFRVTRGGTI